MISSETNSSRAGRGWIRIQLLALALLLGAAFSAHAENCSDYPGGVLDGEAVPPTPAPSQLYIDQNCTIRNYPNGFSTNISFSTQPGQTDERWLVIFDNVMHTGQMSCNAVAGHHIWFVNGSSTGIHANCQNLLIPVEKIDKQNPAGQTTAAIGVPFTYTLIMPVLFDPATGVVINVAGSVNDLHSVTLWDDLNATGAKLTYLSHQVRWRNSGLPVVPAPSFNNNNGFLTFDNFPIIPAGEQILVEITVVLDDTPTNVIGTQFVNTAKWDFGRLIDGTFYEPLPGEWGISPPMTIAGPNLIMTKTGPTTLGKTLNLGEWGTFTLNLQNSGLSDAWNVTLLDRLPDTASGGMCNATPEILSARVFAADGVTPVAGKGPLTAGTDFTVSYAGAPTCELTLTMLTPASTIGANERLIVSYRAQLDADSQDGATFTNVAGAIQWFNGDSSATTRVTYTRALTDGTVGVADHEDAHTVTARLFGYVYEKSVANLTKGVNPATTAAPGDRLRYTLRLQTTTGALNNFSFVDDMGAMNPTAVFVPGSLTLVPGTIPPGANVSNTNPNGGTNAAGLLDIRNMNLPASSAMSVQFDITLKTPLLDGLVVTNQAALLDTVKLADSDDPNVNGQANPNVAGDEDPTRVVIQGVAPSALVKATTQATAAIGEQFSYRITIPSAPHSQPLYDVRILDDLVASAADLQFVKVTKISGSGAWTPVNTGTPTNVVIADPVNGIDIPAGEQAVIEITVVLLDTPTNIAGLTFTNTAAYTYDQLNGDTATQRPGLPGTSGPMTVVEPTLTMQKSGPAQMRAGLPGTFTLNVHNAGGARAFATKITDVLPNIATGGMCDVAPSQITAHLFQADGVTPVGGALAPGTDFSVAFAPDPVCTLTLTMLTPATVIAPGQRLIVTYQTSLDAGSQEGAALTNVAGATDWFSADPSASPVRAYPHALTNGTVGVLDHEDAYTVTVFAGKLMFEKTVLDVTSGANPALVANPGDTLRYKLYVQNVGTSAVTNFNVVDTLDRLNAAPAFYPGTLTLVTVPAGADVSGTNPVGGAAGTGLLDVRALNVAPGESLIIEFEIKLAPVLTNASYVVNQSQILVGGLPVASSDDPNVNGRADPIIVGDEDPTRVQIQSKANFDVKKISTDMTGDPALLLAGETLRYRITVKNIGNSNAVDARMLDALPANTHYVAGSTTLNGNPVADGAGGTPPLSGGINLYAPENPTPGAMRADPSATANNVATIVFDVVVDPSVIDGTVISNQAFVSAVTAGVVDQPSDDPDTPTVNDPTRDIVGSLPLLFAEKAAALQVDMGTPGIVDPGDYLRYTIKVHNNGAIPATMARLKDVVPTNTTYAPDTMTLNGLPVGRPDGGVFPMDAGIWISSSDRTPPLPTAPGEAVLSPGQTATIQFDVRVNDNVPTGTLITNQATVTTGELGPLLTDGDGNPATGPEPTIVVVGDAQQVSITKQVSVVGGGAAIAGATLEYVVTVQNIAAVPAYGAYITDDLNEATPAYLLYVAQSATLNGQTNGITVAGTVITANFGAAYGPLEPGKSFVLRFRAQLEPTLAIGTTVTNIAHVIWNTDKTAMARVSIDVGGMPGSGAINGKAWHDADFDDVADATEQLLQGWTVELRRNGQVVHTTLTDTDGAYRISGLIPNYLTQDKYVLTFLAPGAGPNTAKLGLAASDYTNGPQQISDIMILSGSNLQNLNLPIDPNGVVYNSVTRAPIGGAVLTLLNAASQSPLPSTCFDDPIQQRQVTLAEGYYKFDLNFADPACPSGGAYVIDVQASGAGYLPGYSQIIPPAGDATTPPFDVPGCPGGTNDAVAATTDHCEVQPSELAPPASIAAQSPGTAYQVRLLFDSTRSPGSSQIFNNHIPIDPVLVGAVAISKITPMVNVTRGQMVPYTITVRNTFAIELPNVTVVDRFPPGFKYVDGSARVDGVQMEPTLVNGTLVWNSLTLPAEGSRDIQLLLAVGAGVTEGEFVNHAQAVHSLTGNALSGNASATVRVVPDPTFDCTDVMGKVFNDTNRNGTQDPEELGIAGARLVTPNGLAATTDANGRYHITCAIVPREDRGSNFVLKLDDRTLPTGFRSSTDTVRIARATRGKALRLNFGASIHRVVGLDIADAVFEPGSTEMRPQWVPRINLLTEELQKGPATLRLSYLADVEDPKLVKQRLDAMEARITEAWTALDCCYRLVVEREVFWRTGRPPQDDPRLSEMRGRDQ